MLVSDSRIKLEPPEGRGRVTDGLYPVKMPAPARYYEAMILLMPRDCRGQLTMGHWRVDARYMLRLDHCRGQNLNLDDIEPFREYAKRLTEEEYDTQKGDQTGTRYFCQLYLDMKRSNKLPAPERAQTPGEGWNFARLLPEYGIPFEESEIALD
ncbi:hypothetical protein BDW59DRAFT_131835 [Aspergillus cavernicola]|uniref:Uncharacterized protein n=1 Tax=Aspergillus cavernicola TaxID=176166 RepID=A0ABR4HSN2_9EURO